MKNFETQMNALIDLFRKDYSEWCERANITSDDLRSQDYYVEEGRKYMKIIMDKANGQSSVAGFVCKKDNPKKGFVAGDMLMAATYSAPATNFARGNIFDLEKAWDENAIRWTGIQ